MDEAGPKHRQIFEKVRQDILSGVFRHGERIPSEHELVKQFATSRPTVSRAMRDLQQAGLIDRKVGSGTFVRHGTPEGNQLFGLLIPELGETEIFEPICGQIAQEAQVHRHTLLWGNFNNADPAIKRQQALQVCSDYVARKVAGVFFAPIEHSEERDKTNQQIVKALSDAGIAIVLLDRDIVPFPQRSRFDLVGIDNRRSGYKLTQHLLASGCKRVLFFARPLSAPTVDLRIAGYREALIAAGNAADPKWVLHGDPEDEEFLRQTIKKFKPDGIICANDATAASLMHTLDRIGVSVPKSVRVAGFDDVRYARLLRVPLTSVRQPCRDIGVVAMRTMLERIENPSLVAREILVDTQVIARESCGNSHADPTSRL